MCLYSALLHASKYLKSNSNWSQGGGNVGRSLYCAVGLRKPDSYLIEGRPSILAAAVPGVGVPQLAGWSSAEQQS